ncbi:MAG: hypothetical protein GXP34_13500 [Actinobacteria bacterium]|nr:hypothetical protein [Actinomycetota bacterium]
MSRASVATVLSARPWEEVFVSFARETAAVRVVARAYEPEEATRRSPGVIVAGSETPWVCPAIVKAWRRRGIRVVGIYPAGDEPGRQLFETAGADEILPDDTSSLRLLRTVQALSVAAPPISPEGTLVAVTGPRGAPGRTEIAIAIAWGAARGHRTLLVDLDPPSLGIRLGLRPHPGLADAFDAVRSFGELPDDHARIVGPISVLAGIDGGPLTAALRWELVRSALGSFDVVVVDLGPWPQGETILRQADTAVLVCDAGPTGLIRASMLVDAWQGPTPIPLVNRADDPAATTREVRQALGLEPAGLIPTLASIRAAARQTSAPPRELIEQVAPVQQSIAAHHSR